MAQSQSPDTLSVLPSTEDGENHDEMDEDAKSPEPSTVTDAEHNAMHNILLTVYAYRTDDGDDPSKLFHRKVNRRALPDYYDVIKEPMAMSVIKAKINSREYATFEDFVRDFALIFHNAQVYNSPNARAYQDALIIKTVVERELAKLAKKRIVARERTKLPFLGEIPPADETPAEDGEEEEEEEEEDDEDEDEEDDDSDDDGKKKRRRGRPSLPKREGKGEGKEKEEDPEARKKRGRPPRVDTPMESRIKAIIKGLRKLKDSDGQLMVTNFERLPDKTVLPEYFNEIKQPMALDMIKKKLKRKKYTSVDQFMADVELMFENAKQYNEDESEIYQDAVELQKEARSLAKHEKSKPDSDFEMEDGRIPMPQGILHNGELWKVGDWVHIGNHNDITKPIVAQIYRTWQDHDGAKWVNACWYYRPEQTVHRFDRHFFENEVCKTGQYRDHPIDEILDRCFVMFFTRYNKGRPRGFPADKEVYVCEARYNEEKHKINKIKTWASCLPDEVRDKDYEMDLFDVPRKLKKVPSPLKYLFKEGEQKETDDLPKPVWGDPNAPPKLGAVHCRPRDPKETPPPEPTPTPPPQPPPPPPRQIPVHQPNGRVNMPISQVPIPQSTAVHPSQAPAATPAQLHHQPIRPSLYPAGHQPGFAPAHAGSPMGHYGTPTGQAHAMHRGAHAPGAAYKTPNPIEVWHLPDAANQSIPADVRAQFQRDALGRVLFFTAPPAPPGPPPGSDDGDGERGELKHSTTYLAFRAKKVREGLLAKRKRDEKDEEYAVAGANRANASDGEGVQTKEESQSANNGKRARVARHEQAAAGLNGARHPSPPTTAEELGSRMLDGVTTALAEGLVSDLCRLYRADEDGDEEEWYRTAVARHLEGVASTLRASAERREEAAERAAQRQAKSEETVGFGFAGALGYRPPNEDLEWRR